MEIIRIIDGKDTSETALKVVVEATDPVPVIRTEALTSQDLIHLHQEAYREILFCPSTCFPNSTSLIHCELSKVVGKSPSEARRCR